MRGAGGFDAVFYDLAEAGVEVDLSHQEATGEGTDSLISTETVVGSAFADTILGSTRSNFLIGQGGDDWLNGGAGGVDSLLGGGGPDECLVAVFYDTCENVAEADEFPDGEPAAPQADPPPPPS